MNRIDEFRVALMSLEKKVVEMKQIMRKLQEESLKILSGETPTLTPEKDEDENKKSQLSLSNFRKVKENGDQSSPHTRKRDIDE